jgi:hypothetical protein
MSYLHKDKIRICLRGFGWTQFTSRYSHSCKTRWEYLSSRRKYRKLTTLYKMLNSLYPQILGNCLPLGIYSFILVYLSKGIFFGILRKVTNEERTGKCLRPLKYIRGHLLHSYFITVNQIVVATVKLSKWCPMLTKF